MSNFTKPTTPIIIGGRIIYFKPSEYVRAKEIVSNIPARITADGIQYLIGNMWTNDPPPQVEFSQRNAANCDGRKAKIV